MSTALKISVAAFAVGAFQSSFATWGVAILHPGNTSYSDALATSGSSQAGWVISSGSRRASRWSGTSGSWVDLHPTQNPLISNSEAYAVFGNQQAGRVQSGGLWRASLWNGSGASWVDLQPDNAVNSQVHGYSGNLQVGFAKIGGRSRAGLWNGTQSSFVSLDPQISNGSVALGGSTNSQVGYVQVPDATQFGSDHASIWRGSAETWIDLNPASATRSQAFAASETHQVGYSQIWDYTWASLWEGTAQSWVNLNPVGASASEAYSVSGPFQVGQATINGTVRASLWAGSRLAWVDLHSLLPAGFNQSIARSISSDGINFRIVGWAFRPSASRGEAVLWTIPTQSISGNLVLEDTVGSGESGEETIEWSLSNGLYSTQGTLEVNRLGGGTYTFAAPIGLPGAYTLRLKGGTFLARTLQVNLIGGTQIVNATLKNGDIDQNGEVGPSDFETVVGQFGGIGSADVDNDGEVGPSDFEIIVTNFGLQDN